MKWWIYIAFKQLFPTGRKISFFAIVSVLGVALGVLALYGVQCIMGGFHAKLSEKYRNTTGDVVVFREGAYLYNVSETQALIEADANVVKTEAVVEGPVMMRYGQYPKFPMLRSYDTIKNESALPLVESNYIKKEVLDNLDDDSIILGIDLARSLSIFVGQEVSIYSPTMIDMLNEEEVPMPVRLKVIGFLDSGYSEADLNIAMVSRRRMDELYGVPENSAQKILVDLKEGVDPSAFARSLEEKYKREFITALSWEESNADFFKSIQTEKAMMSLITTLVILVASFSICISLYTSVLRKTREIGLISAMGASPMQIVFCYVFQGLLIGVLGSILGIIFTVTLLEQREYIWQIASGGKALKDVYFLMEIPVKYDIQEAITTCAFAITSCVVAGFIPAILASKLKASEAMRNE